ncbi:MAG: hypothetical protein IAC58_00375 [Firmicutes bacterium]|uniref:Uncharacterized protein n=1 Tax=Candidatus Onthovivens merdipullorum TaxID=2840889 RepID=A0A9D9DGD7_9BACL|nr:hypothetical protein [Candidatus Onthovivens merdipullorum]
MKLEELIYELCSNKYEVEDIKEILVKKDIKNLIIFLEKKRNTLLKLLHKYEDKIDKVDYLIYKIKKNS